MTEGEVQIERKKGGEGGLVTEREGKQSENIFINSYMYQDEHASISEVQGKCTHCTPSLHTHLNPHKTTPSLWQSPRQSPRQQGFADSLWRAEAQHWGGSVAGGSASNPPSVCVCVSCVRENVCVLS